MTHKMCCVIKKASILLTGWQHHYGTIKEPTKARERARERERVVLFAAAADAAGDNYFQRARGALKHSPAQREIGVRTRTTPSWVAVGVVLRRSSAPGGNDVFQTGAHSFTLTTLWSKQLISPQLHYAQMFACFCTVNVHSS